MGFSLNQLSLFAKPALVGLDIGSSSVKLLRMQRQDGEYVVTAAAAAAVEGANDAQVGRENTILAIRSCLQTAGCPTGVYAVCGVEGADVSVRGFRFPPLPDDAVEQAVALEAQQVCPLDIAQSVVDYQELSDVPLSRRQKEKVFARRGYLVVGTSEAISRRLDMAGRAAVRAVIMDINGLAVLNCLCRMEEADSCGSFAVLDIGHEMTNVAILGDDGVPFVRDLPYAAGHIYSKIAFRRQVSAECVRQMFSQEAADSDVSLQNDIEQAGDRLVADINETLRYYTLQEGAKPVQRIWLCGGFARIGCFVKILEKSLPAPVRVFNPFEKMRIDAGPSVEILLRTNGPAMAVAAGLAMRSID